MKKMPKRPTIFPKLQREQYADLLVIIPEEVFEYFNPSLERAKKRLQDQLGEAMRRANVSTASIFRDADLMRRFLAQLRVFLDDRAQPRA